MKNILPCNCRKKHECLLDGKCRAENIVYKCSPSADGYLNKVYLGNAECDFKHSFYNPRMSFNNEGYSTHNTFQICLGNKEEVQDKGITEMVHNQICTSLFKHFQKIPVVSAKKFETLN